VPVAFSALVLAYAAALRAFDPALAGGEAQRLAAHAIVESDAAHVDARLVVALIAVESSWRPHAVSRAGARGLGQLMPATAAALRVDPDDPAANLHGSVVHLARLLTRYRALAPQARYERALAAYNAGAGAVARAGGIPPYRETQLYVRRVIGLWRRMSGG
jgi:soluble lytic murein transglycosylase-like protein